MLLHIYTLGRFGPERHIGFVITDNTQVVQQTSYISFDIIQTTDIPKAFFTNPLGLVRLRKFRSWQQKHTHERGQT